MKTAFVIMPFGKTREDQEKWTDIYEYLIKPVIKDCMYEVLRADEIGHSGNITKDIIRLLWSSDLVVADITSCNANVFYELGIRHALKKHGTIIISNKDEKIPFDITNYRIEFYETGFSSAEKFKLKLILKIFENDHIGIYRL